jgi:putrescine oxidase
MGRAIECDVAVAGAGIAGLVAATSLAREGMQVVVLEARERVGGRLLNVDIGGQPNELGGQWVAPYQSEMHALLAELGIEVFPSHREGEHVYVGKDGRATRYRGHDAPLTAAAGRAYSDGVAKLDALAAALDPEAPWAHPEAAALDSVTYEEWLRREVSDGAARDLLRSFLAGGFMTKPAHSFSLLAGLWVIAGAGGVDNLFEPDLCLAYRVVGGSQVIPIRLAEPLGDRVILGAPVRSCRWSDGSVSFDAADVAVTARAAVIALPPNLTGTIRFEPPLPAWRLRLEQHLSQGSVIKALAVYDRPFWRAEGLSGEGFAPYSLVREVYDNTPPSGSPGVLCTFLAGENAERSGRLGAGERRAAVLAGFAQFVGPQALPALDYHELDWSAEEWTRGAYCATFDLGGLSRFGPDLRRPIGPIHWACTDIAGVGNMHMEGAIRSGKAAAQAVRSTLERVPDGQAVSAS